MSAGVILAIIKILVGLANTIVGWAHDKSVGDQAVWAHIGKSLTKINEDLQKVKDIEKGFDSVVVSDPDSLRRPDEFTTSGNSTTSNKP